jgi:hypothetical protein
MKNARAIEPAIATRITTVFFATVMVCDAALRGVGVGVGVSVGVAPPPETKTVCVDWTVGVLGV